MIQLVIGIVKMIVLGLVDGMNVEYVVALDLLEIRVVEDCG
jgi:hypothetical protein